MMRIQQPGGLYSFRHEAMATDFVFRLGGVDREYARQAAQEAFRVVDDVESKLSLYQEASDISRINMCRVGDTVAISAFGAECLQLAEEASRLSGGRFQVFVGGPACLAKGFLPSFLSSVAKPAQSETGAVISEGDVLALDASSRQAIKLREGVLVDLGGIGKGFALDQVVEVLDDWDIPIAALSSGGSTHLFRSYCESARWVAELGDDRARTLWDGALASSGLGFQERHIIDPQSGEFAARWVRSYVRCASAGMADALSTAAMLMEWEELRRLTEEDREISFAVEAEEGRSRCCGAFFRE